MDEHLRFCKRTYKNDPTFENAPQDPIDGTMWYNTENNRGYCFIEGNWLLMTAPANAQYD